MKTLESGRCYNVNKEECVLLGISKRVVYLDYALQNHFDNKSHYTSTLVQNDKEIRDTLNDFLLSYMEFLPVSKLGEIYSSQNVLYGKCLTSLDKRIDLTNYFLKNKMLDKDFDSFFEDKVIQDLYKKYYEIIKRNRNTVDLNEYFQRFYGKVEDNDRAEFYFDASTLKYYVRNNDDFYYLAKAKSSDIKDILRGRYLAEKKDITNIYFHTKPIQLEQKDLYALFYTI